MTVANKIKAYRLQKAWSQDQLAEVASLSVRTVQRTEKGQKPSLETLGALASAFGVNVSELSEDVFVAGVALDDRISEARNQVRQEIIFYRVLASAVLVCISLMIINYLFTPESYWAVVVTIIWWGLVFFRGMRVFLMRGKITSWQQRRVQKILRAGSKRHENKSSEK